MVQGIAELLKAGIIFICAVIKLISVVVILLFEAVIKLFDSKDVQSGELPVTVKDVGSNKEKRWRLQAAYLHTQLQDDRLARPARLDPSFKRDLSKWVRMYLESIHKDSILSALLQVNPAGEVGIMLRLPHRITSFQEAGKAGVTVCHGDIIIFMGARDGTRMDRSYLMNRALCTMKAIKA